MDVRRVFSGLNVIAVGLILLANTLGYLPWTVWWNILSLWPLLLVAAGLDVLGRAFDWQWLRAVSGMVVLGGLAFGALAMPAAGAGPLQTLWLRTPDGVPYEHSIPQQVNGQPASLRVSEGASTITLGPTDAALVSVTGRASEPVPKVTTSVSGSVTQVAIARDQSSGPAFGGSTMQVGLSRTAAWRAVSVDTGASTVEADLSVLAVEALSLRTGAANVSATLGSVRNCAVDVSAGASSIELKVPDDARVTVVSDSALVGTDLPGFERTSGMGFGHTEWAYAPPGGEAKVSIAVKVSMGAGSLRVTRYHPVDVPLQPAAPETSRTP
jgi:hypothetical protein